jgi:hypothetical protein
MMVVVALALSTQLAEAKGNSPRDGSGKETGKGNGQCTAPADREGCTGEKKQLKQKKQLQKRDPSGECTAPASK